MKAALTLTAALALAAPASADVLVWDFLITEDQVKNGPEADGSTNSPATGSGSISYDTSTNVISYSISWANLFGDLTKLHIHGPADANSSNPQHLLEIFGPPDIPGTVNLDTDTWTDSHQLQPLGGLSTIQIIGIMSDGLAYVNVHTTVFGMGEIRGNLGTPTPTPGPAALLALAGAAASRRRRR